MGRVDFQRLFLWHGTLDKVDRKDNQDKRTRGIGRMLPTIATSQFFALRTALQAICTANLPAVRTRIGAVTTNPIFATIAAGTVAVVENGTTVSATNAAPALELHIGLPTGIGMQQSIDDRKKIKQTTFGQRPTDTRPPLPFAESLSADVRVSDGIVRSRRIGIQRDDPVGLIRTVDFPPVETDLKAAQRQRVQLDRLRADAQLAPPGPRSVPTVPLAGPPNPDKSQQDWRAAGARVPLPNSPSDDSSPADVPRPLVGTHPFSCARLPTSHRPVRSQSATA